MEIFGRAPVECCCGNCDEKDDNIDDDGVVQSNGDDDGVVVVLLEALAVGSRRDAAEFGFVEVAGTFLFRKCFSENGVSSRLIGGVASADEQRGRDGIGAAVTNTNG